MSLWQEIEGLQKRKAELDSQFQSIEVHLKALEARLKIMEEQLKDRNEAINNLESQIAELEKTMKKPAKEELIIENYAQEPIAEQELFSVAK